MIVPKPHRTGIPFAALVAHRYLVTDRSFTPVLEFQHQSLYQVQENTRKKPYFQDTDDDGRSHEISSLIEHFPAVTSPDTGVDTYVNDQKSDQGNTSEAHYEFFAYGRSKEFRPFHNYTFY